MERDEEEMYSGLFLGMATETVELSLSNEMVAQTQELAKENGWDEDEAYRIVFANGLAYLSGQRRLRGLEGVLDDGAAVTGELKRLLSELMDVQSKYAVMKFRAFTLDQAKQVLEFNVTGLRGENRLSAWRLQKFREDEELLRTEIARLKEENERLRGLLGHIDPEENTPRQGLMRRLLPWLRR